MARRLLKVLLPFAWLYTLIIILRNTLFDRGVLKSVSVSVPVISVGNLTVGGTGKTPLVEFILQLLIEKRWRVAVVSRGYKRKSAGVVVVSDGRRVLAGADEGGDEPVQIASKFRDAIVVVGEKRVDAAKKAVELGAEVIVLDDGFQHRYLRRDLDIVVIDSTNDVTRESMLPAGRLREPVSGLRRASVVAFSKFDETVAGAFTLDERLRAEFTGTFIKYRYRIKEVRRAKDDGAASLDIVRTMRLFAFSGIGNHEAFLHELEKNAFAPVSNMRFPDHHRYAEHDIAMLTVYGKAMSIDACITTEKDVARLRADERLAQQLFDEVTVFYVIIAVEILQGKDELLSRIENQTGEHHHHGHRNNGYPQ
jgi:tetraacyldisaccharide 4'-kinase